MLRRAEAGDLPAIARTMAERPMQLLDLGPDWLAETWAAESHHVMVWDRGGFAGFSILEAAYPQVWHLSNLACLRPGDGAALIDATLDLGFGQVAAHRIYLDTAADNLWARAAFRRAGFQEEGVMRQCWLRADGIWCDCIAIGMLQSEWRARRG
jgi:hypothetical protein